MHEQGGWDVIIPACIYLSSRSGPCGVCVACVENERVALRSQVAALTRELEIAKASPLKWAELSDALQEQVAALTKELKAAKAQAFLAKARAAEPPPCWWCGRLVLAGGPCCGMHAKKPAEVVEALTKERDALRANYERQLADMTETLEQANAIYDTARAELAALKPATERFDAEKAKDDLACLKCPHPDNISPDGSALDCGDCIESALLSPAAPSEPACPDCELPRLCTKHFAESVQPADVDAFLAGLPDPGPVLAVSGEPRSAAKKEPRNG